MFTECKKACICSFAGNLLAEVEVVDSHKERMGLIIREEDVRKISAEMIIVFYDGIQGLVTCRCLLYEKVKLDWETILEAFLPDHGTVRRIGKTL